jgi:hypothetical protein
MNEQQLVAVKQALETLQDFADDIRHDNEQDEIGCRVCCGVLSYDNHSENCKAMKSIAALQSIISQDALDKKAENARELGLDYEPAVQEGRDWSLLAATQESLREHMAEIKRLKAALRERNT